MLICTLCDQHGLCFKDTIFKVPPAPTSGSSGSCRLAPESTNWNKQCVPSLSDLFTWIRQILFSPRELEVSVPLHHGLQHRAVFPGPLLRRCVTATLQGRRHAVLQYLVCPNKHRSVYLNTHPTLLVVVPTS